MSECLFLMPQAQGAKTGVAREEPEQPKQRRRGPHKKGKTPREKELEDVVRSLTLHCQSLERQLESSVSVAPLSFRDQTSNGSVEDSLVREGSNNVLKGDPRSAETLPSSTLSSNSARTTTNSFPNSQSIEAQLRLPNYDLLFELWNLYIARVEPLTKLIPYSSFADLLLLAHDPHAVHLAAIDALSEGEVIQRFNESSDAVHAPFNFVRYEEDQDGVTTAYFKDGTNARGYILVGADGANSPVRNQLLAGFKADPSPYLTAPCKVILTKELYEPLLEHSSNGPLIAAPNQKGYCLLMEYLDNDLAVFNWNVCWRSKNPEEYPEMIAAGPAAQLETA
ncbi:hypothetical protein PV04_02358 [Phialophora macrospora]|uniref:FAD-binding domain-containing protein n=1 Tax=Phialophora macrospora TaxID=1851006 RepID=A0A0D2E6Y1_9EURO|nr:hypothetical protein PV04_02358 [Phialophora macrospora]